MNLASFCGLTLGMMLINLVMEPMMTGALAESESTSFRTPAKQFGSAYSIKLILRRHGFTFDIPVWVKPDQKISTLDLQQLAELGWIDKDVMPEDISISGEWVETPNFKNLKSEWVYVPLFSKSCCFGVIGQDILRDYQVKFVPFPPAHLEWTKIDLTADEKRKKVSSSFQKEIAGLFNIRFTQRTFHQKKIDLNRTAYELNFEKETLQFESPWINPKGIPKPLVSPLFQSSFIPSSREVLVLSIANAYRASAQKVGFKSSLRIKRINNILTSALDHFELGDYLTGRNNKKLLLQTDHSIFTFDFEKNEFTQSKPIQSSPRWH